MNRFFGLRAFALVALISQVTASASASDLNVQGSSATGGNASVIRGTIGGPVNFSITGAFGDTATVFNRPGSILPPYIVLKPLTVKQLATGSSNEISPLERIGTPTQLPDGQTRVLLRIRNSIEQFNGGKVELKRGSALIDSDQIELRIR